ncbi:MAG: hypothetical protein KAX78_01680 [Phycisphaerae bacterium]|nr:hypothetical protein [Phycisphaerae bacterium]
MRRALLTMTIAVMLLSGSAGCIRAEFTRQTYETILLGEPASQVQEKLGKPTEQSGETWTYENEIPYYRAQIKFKEGNVVEKVWFIEKQGKPKQRDKRETY